jgi:glycine cleavage system H lipoate-binding protein
MEFPENLLYSKEHIWLKVEDDIAIISRWLQNNYRQLSIFCGRSRKLTVRFIVN